MKGVIIYWAIGCILMGGAFGKIVQECPRDKYELGYIELIGVALWPMLLMAAYEARNADYPSHTCKEAIK